MKRIIIVGLAVFFSLPVFSQKKEYTPVVIGFYNLENLFDTLDNPGKMDEEFTPGGSKNYNTAIYYDKLKKLSTVISQIGTDFTPDGPAILGVAEVEDSNVLADLVKQEAIAKRNYQFIHYEAQDFRGIDVAFLYNPKYFEVTTSKKLFVEIPSGSKSAYFTRDILMVKGLLDGETIYVFVNHWPSRSGGQKRSEPARLAAAGVCKHNIDSIRKVEPNAKIVVMGDLNDDPVDASVENVLGAVGKLKKVKPGDLYNPWTELYKKGIGTLAYRDAWGLFDQIIISYPWLDKQQDGLFFYQQKIFRKEFMIENNGQYKGYPMRTWSGNFYRGGYSDHLPTYLVMLKEKKALKKSF